MKTPLPKFPHHRGVPKHHFGVKTPLLATLILMNDDDDDKVAGTEQALSQAGPRAISVGI